MNTYSNMFADYKNIYIDAETNLKPFIYYYTYDEDKNVITTEINRSDFIFQSEKAAFLLYESGLKNGDKVLHCFSKNELSDLIFRTGSLLLGTVPVTVNWQADTLKKILFKLTNSRAKTIVVGDGFNRKYIDEILKTIHDIKIIKTDEITNANNIDPAKVEKNIKYDSNRFIVYTSGTTGDPKGVQLSYLNYKINSVVLEEMIGIGEDEHIAGLIVNPLHHSNSSSFTEFLLRRQNSHIHLFEKYSGKYWTVINDIVRTNRYDRIIAPTVAKHFEFLENLVNNDILPVNKENLIESMNKINFIVGSAPVGPTVIKYLQKYSGRIPCVRFGGTEMTLQVVGIPHYISDGDRLDIFKAGWSHKIKGELSKGFYIGRFNESYIEGRLVKSINKDDSGYLKDVMAGEAGYIIARGDTLMNGYIGKPDETKEVCESGWYTGLRDIGFFLINKSDGGKDIYWMNRDSGMLIKGGANYSYTQINEELSDFIIKHYKLEETDFDLAVIGLKLSSESEDSCCVTLELITQKAQSIQDLLNKTFCAEAVKIVSTGAKPERIKFRKIPKNFKGAILVNELKKYFSK